MLRNLAGLAVENIHGLLACHPKRSVFLFERGAQERGIVWTGQVTDHCPGCRVDPVQAVCRGQPYHARTVLLDVMDWTFEYGRVEWIMGEDFRRGIKAVESQIRRHPQHSGTILEHGLDNQTTQTVVVPRIGPEIPKTIAVVAPQAVLGAKPQESGFVLHDLSDCGVRDPIAERHGRKRKVSPFLNGQPDARVTLAYLGEGAAACHQ